MGTTDIVQLMLEEESLNRPWSLLTPRQKDIHMALAVYLEKVILIKDEPHWVTDRGGQKAWDPLPHFSKNLNDTMALVSEIANSHCIFEITILKLASGIMYRVIIRDGEDEFMVLDHSLAEAICKCIKEFLDGPQT